MRHTFRGWNHTPCHLANRKLPHTPLLSGTTVLLSLFLLQLSANRSNHFDFHILHPTLIFGYKALWAGQVGLTEARFGQSLPRIINFQLPLAAGMRNLKFNSRPSFSRLGSLCSVSPDKQTRMCTATAVSSGTHGAKTPGPNPNSYLTFVTGVNVRSCIHLLKSSPWGIGSHYPHGGP